MMRQMGGSFGIAFINTFLDHRTAFHRMTLVSKLAAGDPATEGRLSALAHAMMARGAGSLEAAQRALGILEFTVERQASLLSYLDAYRLVGLLSIGCIPLILLAGKRKVISKAAAAAAKDSH
jgi:DHA2 family multidrug resistance protein